MSPAVVGVAAAVDSSAAGSKPAASVCVAAGCCCLKTWPARGKSFTMVPSLLRASALFAGQVAKGLVASAPVTEDLTWCLLAAGLLGAALTTEGATWGTCHCRELARPEF